VQDQADTSSLHPLVYCFCSADTPWLTALGEEIEGVSVTVNRGPIRKAEFLGNGLDTGPVDEFPLDLIAMLMGTDLAVPPVATQIDGPIRTFPHRKLSFSGIGQMDGVNP